MWNQIHFVTDCTFSETAGKWDGDWYLVTGYVSVANENVAEMHKYF